MTVDAPQYAPDKSQAITEVRPSPAPWGSLRSRRLRAGPRTGGGDACLADPVTDYRPLLQQAGFDVLSYAQIPGWQDQVSAAFGEILDQRDALEAELGEAAAGALLLEASITLELQPYCGHVLGIAGVRLFERGEVSADRRRDRPAGPPPGNLACGRYGASPGNRCRGDFGTAVMGGQYGAGAALGTPATGERRAV